MGFMTREEVAGMGFASVGDNVLLSDKASYYNCGNIEIGSNVRIDDFCVLSAGKGGIKIGSFVHIAVYSSIIGAGQITLADFCNISSRVAIYSSNDDYSGTWMTNPTLPEQFTNITSAAVNLGKHVIVGSGSVILPGVIVADGVAVGALSLVSKNCEAFGVYTGVPAKKIKNRKKDLLMIEKMFAESMISRQSK